MQDIKSKIQFIVGIIETSTAKELDEKISEEISEWGDEVEIIDIKIQYQVVASTIGMKYSALTTFKYRYI